MYESCGIGNAYEVNSRVWKVPMKQSLYYNGTILTMEGKEPQYVEAVLVEDGVILAVGDRMTLERDMHASANIVNLQGKTMLPGFVDSHSHLTGAAFTRIYQKQNQTAGESTDSVEKLESAYSRLKSIGLSQLPGLLPAIQETARWYASFGITTVQDAKVTEVEMYLLRLAGMFGMLPIDVACYMVPELCEQNLPKQYPMRNHYSMHVRRAGCKIFLDGSIKERTAWMSMPYLSDKEKKADATVCGSPRMTDEELMSYIDLCIERDWQLNAHANGDAAIEQFLNCYRKVAAKHPASHYLRPTLIHAQTIRKDQLRQCAELGILVSFLPANLYRMGDYYVERVLGMERAEKLSPLRTAIQEGVSYTIHQDTPVGQPDMLQSVHHAVNRVSKGGRILGERERISPYDALRAVTIHAAYQIFEEEHKGSIRAGKEADFVILEQNPLTVKPEKIRDIQVLETVKGDKKVEVRR